MHTSLNFETKLHYNSKLSDLMSVFALSPLHVVEFDTDEKGIERLHERYRDRVCRAYRDANNRRVNLNVLVLRFAENEFVLARGCGCNDVEILAPSQERADALLQEMRDALGGSIKKEAPHFGMLRLEDGDLSCERVENLPSRSDDDFLRLCYGDDITVWMESFSETTVSRTGGFTLLDGPPGTGKTSLIAQMVLRLSATHVFYVLPVAQANAFASADFIPFWQRENSRHADRVKVVVVEDADKLLRRRNDDGGGILPAMLNVADGLAGRMLRLHVVCSINCPLTDLDPAILRPGRLLNHRCFDLLNADAAKRVADHLQRDWRPADPSTCYSLAEVLNPVVLKKPEPKRILGFAA